MRIAFITSLLPAGPAQSGFEIANEAVLKALQEADCDVHMFGFLRSGETHQPATNSTVLNHLVIENAVASRLQKARWLIGSVARGLPVISTKLALADQGHLRAALQKSGPFDAVVINSAPVAGAFPWLAEDYPAMLVAHNVEFKTAEENARTTTGLTATLYRREAKLLKKAEHAVLNKARFIWCFTQEDREGFGLDITAKSAVLPLLLANSIPLPDVEATYDVGLIGTWTWQPNMAGLRWFFDDVAPRLPDDISVGVAGRMPDGMVAPANVKLLGRVADANLFVASCRVMALASRTGTGVQLKTIETFQAGRPAVATRSSVRGFDQLPGNCLVADNGEAFAAALVKLVRDVRAERAGPVEPALFTSVQSRHLSHAVHTGLSAIKPG